MLVGKVLLYKLDKVYNLYWLGKRMIEDDLELNEATKKELEERRKSKDFISHADVKKRFGL